MLPDRSDVESAAARLGEKVRHTPTLALHGDELDVPFRVLLKLELLQHTGSFKARGALNSVMTLAPDGGRVAAASGGNHGAAVAWAARRAGLTADVFVPATATPAKLARIEEYGGCLHTVDGDVGNALEACRELSEREGVPLVHPYDTYETVCGAGTVGLELVEALPDMAQVLLGCGGGGLYTGVAAAVGEAMPVLPVETELCPHLHVAREAGRPVQHPASGAAADSLGPPQIGRLAFETATRRRTTSVLVSEEEVLLARRFLWERVRVLAEPGASVALAAVMAGKIDVEPGATIAVVVSGGNNPAIP